MPCEIVGLHFFADASELRPSDTQMDVDFIRDYAIAHEEAGFDRILIGQTATWPDGFAIANYLASVTSTLKFMVAHRPGFIAPTMAARMFATLDQLSGGRVGIHIITGASDIEMQGDGDYHTKEERYRRSREYVDVLQRTWAAEAPFDFEGDWYRCNGAFAKVKPQQANIPIYWGGSSPLAVELGAECADIYAVGPDTLANTQAVVERFRAEAARHDRHPDFSMSMRVIIGDTEEEAWSKASDVLIAVTEYQATQGKIGREKEADDSGTLSTLAMVARGECQDERLWTGVTKATEGRLHATALVGTAEQVADSLLAYYAIGIDRFLLNGFDTINDVRLFGETLIPLIRQKVAEYDQQQGKS